VSVIDDVVSYLRGVHSLFCHDLDEGFVGLDVVCAYEDATLQIFFACEVVPFALADLFDVESCFWIDI